LEQEIVSGCGISWAICIANLHLAPDESSHQHPTTVLYRLDVLPAAQPTASKALKANHNSLVIIHKKNAIS